MNGIELLLLHMIKKIKGERTVAGPYYILKGKKSGQAIQDAALYGYSQWFGLFPEWSKGDFEQRINQLWLHELIQKDGEIYHLTALGEQELYAKLEQYQFEQRAFCLSQAAINTHEIKNFWNRFTLLAQVGSHYLYHSQHYMPVITDSRVLAWFKSYWRSSPSKDLLLAELTEAVTAALTAIQDELFIHLILDRLSGYQSNGKTIYQLASIYQIPEAVIQLYLHQAIGLLYISIKNSNFYSLKPLFFEESEASKLTESTQVTFNLLNQGLSIGEICRVRGLKQSTIEDHIIEIAIHMPEFDTTMFLPEGLMREIIETYSRLETKKLSVIKAHVAQADYLQIRLALVKEGEYEG